DGLGAGWEQGEVGGGEGEVGGGAAELGCEDVWVGGGEDRRLDRAAGEGLGGGDQVGVQRVVAGHQGAGGGPAGPARAAGLLPHGGEGARVTAHDHGVQAGQVDSQLEGVGRGQAQECAVQEVLLQGAAVLAQVAGAVRG